MLTLEFKEKTEDNEFYFNDVRNLAWMKFKFSEPDKELLYMMTANPFLHRRGEIGYSPNSVLTNRSLSMSKIKEILDFSPVGVAIKISNEFYLVGKGFIAKVATFSNRGFEYNNLKILFAVTSKVGATVTQANDLKIYLDRELHQPQHKRLMVILKPYMPEHKGDLLVTKSVNLHLAYRFELPVFRDARSRAEFSDLMKELFYRGIYWTEWRKKEDKRIEEEQKLKYEEEKRIKRTKEIQIRMLAVLAETDPPVQEVVEAVPVEDFQPGIVEIQQPIPEITLDSDLLSMSLLARERMREFIDMSGTAGVAIVNGLQYTLTDLQQHLEVLEQRVTSQQPIQDIPLEQPAEVIRIQSRRYGRNQALRASQEQLERLREELREPQMEPLPMPTEEAVTMMQTLIDARERMNEQMGITTDRQGRTVERDIMMQGWNPDMPEGLTPTPLMEEPLQTPMESQQSTATIQPQENVPSSLVMPSDSVSISDEEMARVLSGFSIDPNANVQYSTLLHPITGNPIVEGQSSSIDPEEVRLFVESVYRADPSLVGGIVEGVVDDSTEIVIIEDDSGELTIEEARDAHEEELDNNPDAYIDADVIEDEDPPTATELNQMMIDGVVRAAREGRL